MSVHLSTEEKEFNLFLEQAKKFGFVASFEYEPITFELIPKATKQTFKLLKRKNKLKKQEKTVYQAHWYTPDFIFCPTDLFLNKNHGLVVNTDNTIIIDTKGAYNRHGGDRIFPIHQKLLYYIHGLHVNKVVPIEFFKRFGICPDELRWMKNRKIPTKRKHYQKILSFEEHEKKEKV